MFSGITDIGFIILLISLSGFLLLVNLLHLLLICELVWISVYLISIIYGCAVDSLLFCI